MVLKIAWLSLVLIAIGAFLGCGKREGTDDAMPPVPAVKAPPVEAIDAPALEAIPDGPVTGVLADRPFEAKTIIVEPNIAGELTTLIFSAQETDGSDILIDDLQVQFGLPESIRPGLVVEREMDEDTSGDVVYRYYDDDYGGQLCVTSTYSALLVIESGEAGEYDPSGPTVQNTGAFRGRVEVHFDDEATGGEKPLKEASWIAGSFEAQVRHASPPMRSSSPQLPKEDAWPSAPLDTSE